MKVFQVEEPWAQVSQEVRLFNVSSADCGEEEVNVHPDRTVGPKRDEEEGKEKKESVLRVSKCIFKPSPNTNKVKPRKVFMTSVFPSRNF